MGGVTLAAEDDDVFTAEELNILECFEQQAMRGRELYPELQNNVDSAAVEFADWAHHSVRPPSPPLLQCEILWDDVPSRGHRGEESPINAAAQAADESRV